VNRILIVTGGLSPAVVTETVWALAAKRNPPFWPERVITVVTASVVSRYREILAGPQGKIAELAAYLEHASAPNVEIEHTECDDIRGDADAIQFGDKVCEVVQRETRDENAVVHLSLAGGRKTMSFHGGAALNLFGRPRDELSHVLVTPQGLEGCPDFWWPTREHRLVAHRDQKNKDGTPRPYNTQEGDGDDRARVDLALIPFVRVRGRLPQVMLQQPMDYARYVALVNASIEGNAPVLELIVEASTLKVADGAVRIKLEPQEFAVYRVLAERAQAALPGAGPSGTGLEHRGWINSMMITSEDQNDARRPLQRLYEFADERFRLRLTTIPQTNISKEQMLAVFRSAIGNVRTRIDENVPDEVLASRLLGRRSRSRGPQNPPRYGLLLSPHEIVIRASENGPELAPFARTMLGKTD
jgi:CRISPR-associated protein (TIGR02584 family)